ncbi:MAG: hypothetical protein HY475_00990 [Candidatus Terrybacteria bacterium]|nr:hypothetical protein [Candidatus Terrybacteria bacterium]
MWFWVLAASLGTVAAVPVVIHAQQQYKDIALPPYEFYEALVGYAENENYDGLGRAMRHLDPLFSAVRERFGTDVKGDMQLGMRQRDNQKVLASIFRLLFLDMKLNLEAARKARPADKNQMIEMGYLNYRFLSPRVAARNKKMDAAIKADFKAAYRSEDATVVAEKVKAIVSSASELFNGSGDERP